ncbi:ankyrin repeat domain-containing protein SOWAHC isoform X2 [Drosophila gunungcola]|uniref:ankyrin repeat domain-containing protein SOWAHC isoform X2 n=1 Tax=Drosophila gunungcola TaxID=103775 RepID=UPI0022DFC6A4|nr:ankyrin repeat domain-containing protein SOWAHC isoform X2 [Drosophila gunungcola]
MELPKELSIAEIRNYMLANECKVTNHALVKHFKKFLTHPQSQNEARKRFKTYVTLLSTIKNENNQKFLILRKKYVNECPTEEVVERAVSAASSNPEPSSPGGGSLNFDSPMRQPPPYKPPPMVTSPPGGAVSISKEHQENYQECVDEFAAAIKRIEPARLEKQPSVKSEDPEKKPSRSNSIDVTDNKENIPRFSFSSEASTDSNPNEKPEKSGEDDSKPIAVGDAAENPISVKEATRKFNRMASEEEAKIISPPAKKKPEKQLIEEKDSPEVTLAHPKAKEWIVSMAKANYQELAKMASEYPELVKLQCPATTALHWAAKHGNEDVVKLIAGTYRADVNARTNGGYTPLHLATQFGRDNIFELLWNVYKANRDIMDWSGNKPLDYSRQRSSVSASTCSKIKARKKHAIEKDLGFLRIGSLNVRVKKTTEAFSNFLGVGNGSGVAPMAYGSGGGTGSGAASRHHHRSPRVPHQRHHHHVGTTRSRHPNQRAAMSTPYGTNGGLPSRASVPNNRNIYDGVHKSWGSADNIPQRSEDLMPPPKTVDYISKRNKSSKRSSYASNATDSPRDSICSSNSSSNLNGGYSSMPTTPNQLRAPKGIATSFAVDSDSDSACGFDSSWSVNCRGSSSSNPSQC